jgi:hypothetical protein
MNVKLLAASALLVQSGALLVSSNYKFAYGVQTVNNIVFCCRYAGWYTCNRPMLSQGKAAVHQRPANLFLHIQV